MNKFKNVSMLVVGGLAIHLVLIACSSGVGVIGGSKDATTGNTPGLDSAHAQEATAKCTQWEVKGVAPANLLRQIATRDDDGYKEGVYVPAPFQIESGWEPLGSYGYSNNAVLLRRCVK